MTTAPAVTANKRLVLFIATVTAFIMPFLIAAVNVALPTMGRELNLEAVVMTWVSTIYFLALAVAQVPLGRLSDIFGRKRLFVIGLFIAGGASVLGGLAQSVPVLLVSRALQGIGAGLTLNNSIAILSSVYGREERGQALGISMAGTYLGLALGPLIGGLLTESFGWRSIFFVSAGLTALLVVLIYVALKAEWREASGERFDLAGAVIYSVAIALFMYGFSEMTTVPGVILLVIGAAGLVFFVRWESRVASPVFHLELFRANRVFLLSNLATLVTYLSTFAVTYLLSLYLQYIMTLKADRAGLVLAVSSFLMAVFTPISGHISDRIEPRLVATAGMALNCVALFMFIFLGSDTSLGYIIVALAVYGLGIGLFSSPNTNAIMGAVEQKAFGVASGTVGTMRTAGMMLSMGITIVLFALYLGNAEITPANYPDFIASVRTGFIVFTVLGFGGFVAQALARGGGVPAAGPEAPPVP
jgi:EmrB/QacA subfamily drug resistance transporter